MHARIGARVATAGGVTGAAARARHSPPRVRPDAPPNSKSRRRVRIATGSVTADLACESIEPTCSRSALIARLVALPLVGCPSFPHPRTDASPYPRFGHGPAGRGAIPTGLREPSTDGWTFGVNPARIAATIEAGV